MQTLSGVDTQLFILKNSDMDSVQEGNQAKIAR